jgi:hypothetical protein
VVFILFGLLVLGKVLEPATPKYWTGVFLKAGVDCRDRRASVGEAGREQRHRARRRGITECLFHGDMTFHRIWGRANMDYKLETVYYPKKVTAI